MDTPLSWLIVNRASGSNDPATVAALRDVLRANRVIDLHSDGLPDRPALIAAGVGRVAVFAGDGTMNAAVARLERWDGEVLVLPGGTANLLAKALHGERDALAIASAPDALRRVRRTCIRSSQGTALIELLAGPGATWSDVREGMRSGDIATVAARGVEALRQSTVGPMVRIVEPELGREGGYAGVRLCTGHADPSGSGMDVEGYAAETIADYLRQGVALLRRDFREGPHDDLGRHAHVRCRSLGDAPIALMIDGERHTGAMDERFSLAELPVNLLASQ